MQLLGNLCLYFFSSYLFRDDMANIYALAPLVNCHLYYRRDQFNYTVPLMLNGSAKWGIKTGFFFGCTGLCVVIVGYFIMPELARRTPAEIDEM